MTFLPVAQSGPDFNHHLAVLARVRAQCERIIAAIPVAGTTTVWTGLTEKVFSENLVAMRRRACDAIVWIDDAEHALRRAMASSCSG